MITSSPETRHLFLSLLGPATGGSNSGQYMQVHNKNMVHLLFEKKKKNLGSFGLLMFFGIILISFHLQEMKMEKKNWKWVIVRSAKTTFCQFLKMDHHKKIYRKLGWIGAHQAHYLA